MRVSDSVMRQLKTAIPAAAFAELEELTKKKEKDRPRVAVLVSPQLNACDYYRAYGPIKELDKRDAISARLVHAFSVLDSYSSDLMVCFRPKDRGLLRYVQNPAACHANLLADYDDDVMSVPSANFLESNFGEPDKGASLSIAGAVTQLSVSTRRLRDLFAHVQPRCAVIPNTLDWSVCDKLLQFFPKKPRPAYRVGWAGTYTHTEDLMGWSPDQLSPPFITAVREFMLKHLDVELHMFGMCPESLRKEFETRVIFKRPVHLFDYMTNLASMDLDLMLYPLNDFQFNYSKSNIRWLECAAVEVPLISSPIHSYLDIGDSLVKTVPFRAESWFEAMEYAYHNRDEMMDMARRSRDWVQQEWTIQQIWPAWYAVWSAASEGRCVIEDFTPPTYVPEQADKAPESATEARETRAQAR